MQVTGNITPSSVRMLFAQQLSEESSLAESALEEAFSSSMRKLEGIARCCLTAKEREILWSACLQENLPKLKSHHVLALGNETFAGFKDQEIAVFFKEYQTASEPTDWARRAVFTIARMQGSRLAACEVKAKANYLVTEWEQKAYESFKAGEPLMGNQESPIL